MKHFVFIFNFLLVILAKVASAQYNTTNNGCFYSQYRTINGLSIANFPVQGVLAAQLTSCCDFCRALAGCVAWRYTPSTCFFYREVTSFGVGTVNDYIGKNSDSPFWISDIEYNRWYYESRLWTLQGSTLTVDICYQDCFFKWNTCKSWMYNSNTFDCYHSTSSHQFTNNVYITGMMTGNINMNL